MTRSPAMLIDLESMLIPGARPPQAGRGRTIASMFGGRGGAGGATFPLGADEALLRDIGVTRSAIRRAIHGRP